MGRLTSVFLQLFYFALGKDFILGSLLLAALLLRVAALRIVLVLISVIVFLIPSQGKANTSSWRKRPRRGHVWRRCRGQPTGK